MLYRLSYLGAVDECNERLGQLTENHAAGGADAAVPATAMLTAGEPSGRATHSSSSATCRPVAARSACS